MEVQWADMGMTSPMPTVDEDITEVLLLAKLQRVPGFCPCSSYHAYNGFSATAADAQWLAG